MDEVVCGEVVVLLTLLGEVGSGSVQDSLRETELGEFDMQGV